MQVERTELGWRLIPWVTAALTAGVVPDAAHGVWSGPPRECLGDLDTSGAVDGADMGILLSAWNSAGPADLDQDGLVNGADIGVLLSAWGPCPGTLQCPDSDHDCVTIGPPGCQRETCCTAVCLLDSFCCTFAWDQICVSSAYAICFNETCPPAEHDCLTSGEPGCADVTCCKLVCSIDPFCCSGGWDAGCVSLATTSCAAESTCCAPQGTPGCDDPECMATLCPADPFCCAQAWDAICAEAAQTLCAVLCGNGPLECPPSDHDCVTVGGPGCTEVECCDAVCRVVPECCIEAWDRLCVEFALDGCGLGAAPPGSGTPSSVDF